MAYKNLMKGKIMIEIFGYIDALPDRVFLELFILWVIILLAGPNNRSRRNR